MKWLPDLTGRFSRRPHYGERELDDICEALVGRFLVDLRGKVEFPVSTDDLEKLVERHAEDLDLYADLTPDGGEVEGVTRFRFGRRPSVAVSGELYQDGRRSNRLRTTLTHELGHVVLHDQLFQVRLAHGDLFADKADDRVVCKRDRMVDAPAVDWLEWQACYASGAFLMPRNVVVEAIRDASNEPSGRGEDPRLREFRLIDKIVTRFQVSRDAARVRLLKLGMLAAQPASESLFG